MRRNPVRETKKKFDDNCIRPRLLTTKRRGNNDDHVNNIIDKKHTKLSTVPYMNTRSVTKKCITSVRLIKHQLLRTK